MEIFYVFLILLFITRAFSEQAVRFQQPALVGELLSGIVLGAVIKLSLPSFPIMNSITEMDTANEFR
jgi:Kef-type K+ transport system membrane component KefB